MIDAKLSLVLPAYNEEENIEAVVRRATTVLPDVVRDYEVVVVNDGSRDRTPEIIDRLAAENPKVHPVHHEVNRHYGGALRSGFAAATGDLIMFMDSDRQFDIADITALLPYVPHYEIVAGYRIKRQDPAHRLLFAKMFDLAVLILFRLRIHDIDCAFKIYDAELLKSFDLQMPGALINTEMLALAKRRNARIVQVGVHHYPRQAGQASGGSPRVIVRAMGETLRLWWRLQREHGAERKVDPESSKAILATLSAALLLLAALARRGRR
jgi:glycosyltransferase involved in cell wall biosynthesis